MNNSRKQDKNNTHNSYSFEEFALSVEGGKFLPGGGLNTPVWAELFQCSEDTIHRWLKKYKIKALKLGKETFIRPERFYEHEAIIGSDDGKEEIEEG